MKALILFLSFFLISQCGHMGRIYSFKFHNNSKHEVYVIVDFEPEDNHITAGSDVWFTPSTNWRYIDKGEPWLDVVKDGIIIYVIDASLVDIDDDCRKGRLSQETVGKINQEMILGTIILTNEDFQRGRITDVFFPHHLL